MVPLFAGSSDECLVSSNCRCRRRPLRSATRARLIIDCIRLKDGQLIPEPRNGTCRSGRPSIYPHAQRAGPVLDANIAQESSPPPRRQRQCQPGCWAMNGYRMHSRLREWKPSLFAAPLQVHKVTSEKCVFWLADTLQYLRCANILRRKGTCAARSALRRRRQRAKECRLLSGLLSY